MPDLPPTKPRTIGDPADVRRPAPAHVHDDHHAPTIARNARIGLWLFALYLLLYGGFMVLNAFYPRRMAQPAFAGVNLAITYGMVLIIGAFVLALLYMFLVRARAQDDAGHGGNDGNGGEGR